MKKSRYSDSQIINILKQAEAGTPVPELCREHGMSSATFYKWRHSRTTPAVRGDQGQAIVVKIASVVGTERLLRRRSKTEINNL